MLQAAVGPSPQRVARAGRYRDATWKFLALGSQLFLTAPGHRVSGGISQETITYDYKLGEMNTYAQWDFYDFYRAGKVIKSLTAIISAPFFD